MRDISLLKSILRDFQSFVNILLDFDVNVPVLQV